LGEVVRKVFYEEYLSIAEHAFDKAKAGNNVVDTVKDELLLITEVGVLYLKGELMFKATDVEALCIFCNCYQVYLHVNYKFGSDLEYETNDVSIRVFFSFSMNC
jgi:hypothetical protein